MYYKQSLTMAFLAFCLILAACSKDEGSNVSVQTIKVEGSYITDGLSSQMSATIVPDNASNKEVLWSVSDEQIATISTDGLLTAIQNGNITVTATAADGSGVTGTKLINIDGVIIDVESIQIEGGDITDGQPKQYTAIISPSGASQTNVEWSVSNPALAVIGSEGLLTPLANGTVIITATLVTDASIKAEAQISISGFIETTEVFAFPGAEGFGREATGGRGGQVVFVTNLNDSGTGSLRQAISQGGARYIVFTVSGTIKLNSSLTIRNGNVTIAGQTAPGDGITIRDYPVTVDADNVIIRYIRFRMGDAANQEGDALGGRFHKNIIVDHCSMSWSTDECVSFYANENTTVQWCFIAESLRNSVHDKGAHGYGGIWGGRNASFHHNLLAHHSSRNPRLGEEAGKAFALTDLTDLRNNVIYNWSGNSCYGGEGMNVNIVNCYYKPGPATGSAKERIISIDKNKNVGTEVYDIWGKFFIDGNYLEGSTRATNDNWTYGVYNQYHSSYGTVPEQDKINMRMASAHDIEGNVTTHTAQEAYTKVLAYGGASLIRDAIDLRVADEVNSGTYTYAGSNGSTKGIIDTQGDVGGWPVLASTAAPLDTSKDGIPNDWKSSMGLDPNKFEANGHELHSGYENIEVYINSLVKSITEAQN